MKSNSVRLTNEIVGPKLSCLLSFRRCTYLSTLVYDLILTPQTAAKNERDHYKTEEAVIENPLKWWKNKERFPGLATLVKRYLPITATSVPLETAFSLVGHMLIAKGLAIFQKIKLLYQHCSHPSGGSDWCLSIRDQIIIIVQPHFSESIQLCIRDVYYL